jgi:endonuclease-3
MTQKQANAAEIVSRLKARYPDPTCALEYQGQDWKLMVMGTLSAQCTDARVNLVCRDLFSRYPTPKALADAPLCDVENAIRSCGLYKTKAKNIRAACARICEVYGGRVPREMDDLLTLPGVGRKVANLLRGDLFHLPAVVADTHCIRISARLGLCPKSNTDPRKTEAILSRLIAPEEQSDLCHRLVWFGREVCTARAPKCEECELRDLCKNCPKKKQALS